MKNLILLFSCMLLFCYTNCYANEMNENSNIKYYKTIYNLTNNESVTNEINVYEYEQESNIMTLGTSVITEYKKLAITTSNNIVNLTLEWKNMPKYRSYDVIAIRGENVNFNTSGILGTQFYNNDNINYTSQTKNTKVYSNGVGISMNLVDNASSYTLELKASYTKTNANAKIYGSYQHAQTNVTLAQSQKYTISSNGYGSVVQFDSDVKKYYDGMNGVSIGA